MSTFAQHGYLLIYDISGYTSLVVFGDQQPTISGAPPCMGNPCRNIPSLDLKFIAHHGDYIIQQVRDIREMVGSDVNLIHRLLKNHVAEATGWRALPQFTQRTPAQPKQKPRAH